MADGVGQGKKLRESVVFWGSGREFLEGRSWLGGWLLESYCESMGGKGWAVLS